MIKTRLCDLLDIDAPMIQAAIWPATSPELVAAVGEAGA
jgi:NAD(P)H-dependent flavin oxidoreductase YrpB (nitropropane dioxygenase family)